MSKPYMKILPDEEFRERLASETDSERREQIMMTQIEGLTDLMVRGAYVNYVKHLERLKTKIGELEAERKTLQALAGAKSGVLFIVCPLCEGRNGS